MARSKSGAWVAGAGVAAVVIGGGAWFGLVGPTLAEADEAQQAAADQRDHNELLTIQINQLKAEFAHLDDDRAELARLRTQIPEGGELVALTRQLQDAATAAGIAVTVVSPGLPTPVMALSPEPTATPATTDDPSQTDSAQVDPGADDQGTGTAPEGETGSAPAAPETAGVDGFYSISLSVTTVGTYDQTVAFIDAVQESMPRLFVVSQVSASVLDAAGAGGGRPATNPGDLETTITGVVLTLEGRGDSSDEGAGDESTPAPLPVPNGQRNPFAPIS